MICVPIPGAYIPHWRGRDSYDAKPVTPSYVGRPPEDPDLCLKWYWTYGDDEHGRWIGWQLFVVTVLGERVNFHERVSQVSKA